MGTPSALSQNGSVVHEDGIDFLGEVTGQDASGNNQGKYYRVPGIITKYKEAKGVVGIDITMLLHKNVSRIKASGVVIPDGPGHLVFNIATLGSYLDARSGFTNVAGDLNAGGGHWRLGDWSGARPYVVQGMFLNWASNEYSMKYDRPAFAQIDVCKSGNGQMDFSWQLNYMNHANDLPCSTRGIGSISGNIYEMRAFKLETFNARISEASLMLEIS